MRGLSLKQHNPHRKREVVMAGARGGHLCFAKEAIIKGQSDYLCISVDPLCRLSPLFFLMSRPATLSIMSLVWNTLTKKPHWFVCNRKQDGRSLTAKRLKGCGASAKKGRGLFEGVSEWQKVREDSRRSGRGKDPLSPPSRKPPEESFRRGARRAAPISQLRRMKESQ